MDKKSRKVAFALGVAFLLSSAAALTVGETQVYTDTIGLTSKTREMMSVVASISASDSLPVFFTFYDTLMEPLPGVKCVLETRKLKTEKLSDANGEVLFWVPRNQRHQVKINAYSNQPLKRSGSFTLMGTTKAKSGLVGFFTLLREARNAPIVTGYGLPEIKDSGIRVLYYEGHKDEAQKILDTLLESKAVIDSVLGIKLDPLKILLTVDPYLKLVVGGAWEMKTGDTNGDGYRIIPHEWVEQSLNTMYGDSMYNDEISRTRWIGDGLASYAANEVCKRYYPKGYSNLYDEEDPGYDTLKTYDLKKWGNPRMRDPGGGEDVGFFGYLAAPYFWAKVVEKSANPQLIPQFLDEIRLSEDKSSDTAIAILSRLSGLDIASELVIQGSEFRENVGRYWPNPDTTTEVKMK